MDTPLEQERATQAARANASTRELVREAIDEARELVRLEVLLAKDELKEELAQAKGAGVAFGVAGVCSMLGLALVLVALALVIKISAVPAFIIGLVLLASAGLGGYIGRTMMPKQPLGEARQRAFSDLEQLKKTHALQPAGFTRGNLNERATP